MTQTPVSTGEVAQKPQAEKGLITFQEYLEYEGDPDVIYELVKGQLRPMSASTHLDTNIAKFLVYKLQRYFAEQNLALVANSLGTGVRTGENSARIPDVLVYNQSVWEEVRNRPGAGVLDFAEKPILVVEIVSTNRREDYIVKRSEYALTEISEYWLVDPKKKRVRVLANLSEEGYDTTNFTGDSYLVPSQFEQLVLSVQELLNPPLVEELIKEEQAQAKTWQQDAENERLRAESEHQRAENERLRAENERLRAEKLAQRLREMGVNPEEI